MGTMTITSQWGEEEKAIFEHDMLWMVANLADLDEIETVYYPGSPDKTYSVQKGDSLTELLLDFLPVSFRKLIVSKRFSKMSKRGKENIRDQYENVKYAIGFITDFMQGHREEIDIYRWTIKK